LRSQRFEEKCVRILEFIATNGPSSKKQIEKKIKPSIDKPTIYKALASLEDNQLVAVHHRETVRVRTEVKYYQVTRYALGVFMAALPPWEEKTWDARRFSPLFRRLTSERKSEYWVRGVLEKNPDIISAEWFGIAEALGLFSERRAERRLKSMGESVTNAPIASGWFPSILFADPQATFEMLMDEFTEDMSVSEAISELRDLFTLLRGHSQYAKMAAQVLKEKLESQEQMLEDTQKNIAVIRPMLEEISFIPM
jgi:DNA-binding PadR family transcriptional regulator